MMPKWTFYIQLYVMQNRIIIFAPLCDANYLPLNKFWLLVYLMQNKEKTMHLYLMIKQMQYSDIQQQVYMMQYFGLLQQLYVMHF